MKRKATTYYTGPDKKSIKVTMPVVKGRERVSGFYGRYNLPGGGSENKFFDTALSFTCDATGEVPATGQLCLIPQGVTESTRIGRRAQIKSIQIKGRAQFLPSSGTVGSTLAYVYVVLDKQCNGAAAGVTDVMTSDQMSTNLINLANSERFVILKKFQIHLASAAGVSAAYSSAHANIEWYHKCNIPLEFSSTTGAITELKSNNIFLLAGAISSGDDLVGIDGACRLRFSDD